MLYNRLANAWDVLGLPEDASDDAVDKAFRERARKLHPDSGPTGDSERFRELETARATIRNYRLDNPAEPAKAPITVRLLAPISGGGKTRETARAESARSMGQTIIGALTILLVNEISEHFDEFEPVRPVTVITSEDDQVVRPRLKTFLRSQGKRPFILIVTHRGIQMLPGLLPRDYYEEVELICDEVTDDVAFVSVRCATGGHRRLTHWLDASPYKPGILQLTVKPDPEVAEADEEVDEEADEEVGDTKTTKHKPASPRRILSMISANYKDDGTDEHLEDITRHLIDHNRIVLVGQEAWNDLMKPAIRDRPDKIECLVITKPEVFSLFLSYAVMGAFARSSLFCRVYERLFGVRFVDHPLTEKLPHQHSNGDKLTIYYAFEERVTGAFLDLRDTRTAKTMRAALAIGVAEFLAAVRPDEPFAWSAPQPNKKGGLRSDFFAGLVRKRPGGAALTARSFLPAMRLPGRSLGLNIWRGVNVIALLSVLILSDQQAHLLAALGFTEAELFEVWTEYFMYQDSMRCSIRDPSVNAERLAVVVDLPSANALAARFAGCTVLPLPAEYVPVAKAKRQGPGRPRSANPMPNSESARNYRRRRNDKREAALDRDNEAP